MPWALRRGCFSCSATVNPQPGGPPEGAIRLMRVLQVRPKARREGEVAPDRYFDCGSTTVNVV
jgi:hypothetical protein